MKSTWMMLSFLLSFTYTTGWGQRVIKENIPENLNSKSLLVVSYQVDNRVTSVKARQVFKERVEGYNQVLKKVMADYPFEYRIIDDPTLLDTAQYNSEYLVNHEPGGFGKHNNAKESAFLYTFYIEDLESHEKKNLMEVYNGEVYDVEGIYKNLIKTIKKKYKVK